LSKAIELDPGTPCHIARMFTAPGIKSRRSFNNKVKHLSGFQFESVVDRDLDKADRSTKAVELAPDGLHGYLSIEFFRDLKDGHVTLAI
jgi:hypothetical protein